MKRLAFCLLICLGFSHHLSAQFAAGNIAVVRIGTGSMALDASGFQTSIFQFNSSLQTVNSSGVASTYNAGSSTAITTIAMGAAGLQLSGSGTTDGHLSRSADGRTLLLGGYSNTAGAASIVSSSTSRSIARITAAGTSSVQVITAGPFGTQSHRSVTSIDGTRFWAVGSNTGVVTGANTATNNSQLTTVSTTSTSNRVTGIYGSTNSLFFGDTSGLFAIAPGSAAPTTTGNAATTLFLSNVHSFWMTDRSPTVNYAGTGLDTAYIIGAAGGRIDKYEWNNTSWVSRGTADINVWPSLDVTGYITGQLNGSNVSLFGVFDIGGPQNNFLYETSDISAFGANISLSGTTSIRAGPNYSFRGVAITPIPEPGQILTGVVLILVVSRIVRRHVSSVSTCS
ncbi:MAG: hypothetical protein ACRC8S_22590 [Fimbriiglobus sp.]